MKRFLTVTHTTVTTKVDIKPQQEESKEDEEEEREDPQLKNCWRTPGKVIDWLKIFEGLNNVTIVGDACASEENHLFPLWFSEEDDAMSKTWHACPGTTCCGLTLYGNYAKQSYWFINPPYGKTSKGYDLTDWLRKCYNQACKGIGVIALIPASNGEKNRWNKYVFGKAAVIYNVEGRLKFGDPRTGKLGRAANFGSWIVVWKPELLCEECNKGELPGFETVIKPLYL